jgi:hypothetical protein
MALVPSEGTLLKLESATPGTFDTVAQVMSIGGPGSEVASVPTTTLTSTRKTFRAGKIPDEGEVTFHLQTDPILAGYIALYTHHYAGTTKNWQIINNDGNATPAKQAFAGFITKIDEGDKADETNVEADVTIKITGSVTRTPGTP